MDGLSNPAYTLQAISGSGLGVVATRHIPGGTLIVSEPPLFTLPGRFTLAGLFTNIDSKARALPEDQQKLFFSLHNAYLPDYPSARGIIKTNAQPLGAGSTSCGIFPTCSRFNHSCAANANYAYNPTVAEERVHAIKDIAPGDEITVSYLSLERLSLTRSRRQQVLLREFRFECRCSLCQAPPELIAASDERRAEIAVLNKAIEDEVTAYNYPATYLRYCKRVIELYKEEGASGLALYSTYLDALQVCVLHGDLARCSAFAALAVDLLKKYLGENAPNLGEVEPFVKKPETHPSVGMWGEWSTDKRSGLELGTDGFEEWLWSRAE